MSIILPTSYFGSIAYFRELSEHNNVLIEAKENFPKQTYRNRCELVSADGIISLSIPTKRIKGSKTKTEDIILSDDENWRIRHWRSIKSCYQSAAYFDYYKSEIEELLFTKKETLLNFNINITKRIIKWLDINTEIRVTKQFKPYSNNDLRIKLVDKNNFQKIKKSPYIQVFQAKTNFKKSLSILDPIMCEGPMARNLIVNK